MLTEVFTTLKQQLETTKIEEVKESDYVIIIDEPIIPLKRSKPNKRLIIILVVVMGTLIGFVIAILREFLSARTKEDKYKINQAKIIALNNLSGIFWINRENNN